MQKIMREHLRGFTMAEAKAEANRDIEHMARHGWKLSHTRADRDASGFFVDVTYTKGEADE